MNKTIFITGGTGKTGRRVAEKLHQLDIPVRIGSRKSVTPFDWYDRSTWQHALAGMDKVYITFQPDLAIPVAKELIEDFVWHSGKANISKLVLLSGRGEPEAVACENIVKESGIAYTIVRASWFMQNFSENFMADGILSREFTLPYTTAREPFVDADDIADVVIASLTGDNHSGKTYELTGPELLSFEEAVDKISFALNENVVFHQLNMNHYVALLRDYGIPGDTIALIQYLFTVVLDGRNESIINDIERVLDRPVGTFDQYVQKTIQSGIWSAQKQTA